MRYPCLDHQTWRSRKKFIWKGRSLKHSHVDWGRMGRGSRAQSTGSNPAWVRSGRWAKGLGGDRGRHGTANGLRPEGQRGMYLGGGSFPRSWDCFSRSESVLTSISTPLSLGRSHNSSFPQMQKELMTPTSGIKIKDATTECCSKYLALSNYNKYQLLVYNYIFKELSLLIIKLSPLCLLPQPAHSIKHFLLFWARKEGSQALTLRTWHFLEWVSGPRRVGDWEPLVPTESPRVCKGSLGSHSKSCKTYYSFRNEGINIGLFCLRGINDNLVIVIWGRSLLPPCTVEFCHRNPISFPRDSWLHGNAVLVSPGYWAIPLSSVTLALSFSPLSLREK